MLGKSISNKVFLPHGGAISNPIWALKHFIFSINLHFQQGHTNCSKLATKTFNYFIKYLLFSTEFRSWDHTYGLLQKNRFTILFAHLQKVEVLTFIFIVECFSEFM